MISVAVAATAMGACDRTPAKVLPVSAEPAPTPFTVPDSYYGEWVVADVKLLEGEGVISNDPNFAPTWRTPPDAPAWIGSRLSVTKDMIRLQPAPRGLERREAADTCTRPVFSIDDSVLQPRPQTDVDRQFGLPPDAPPATQAEVYRQFGLPPAPERHAYVIDCHAEPEGDAELSWEETAGPWLLHPYSADMMVMEWAIGTKVLLKRTPPGSQARNVEPSSPSR
ncbi:hypothetical protein [Caulobacter sp. 17J80-11]|uniref:hypothetical protein n=1 Tax=Caulobacter sp. 17J80-11 TaxID=2763502 RepID=UPI001653C629|nr:hypothetical protein [Caulobacter sp. 17J80-11]MBC6980909.1 hypothetical protein [Caulobacter sp. 17J80-11]